MSNINDLIKEMRDMAELEKFTKKQYATILELSKKNTELENEIVHLKVLLESANIPVIGPELSSSNDPHEKLICEIQLRRLNEVSMQRELTAEESKKVETYSKILATFRKPNKEQENPVKNVDTADLLQLVKNTT